MFDVETPERREYQLRLFRYGNLDDHTRIVYESLDKENRVLRIAHKEYPVESVSDLASNISVRYDGLQPKLIGPSDNEGTVVFSGNDRGSGRRMLAEEEFTFD